MEQDLLRRLLDQAFLYDDPSAYQAGVQAAWGVLARPRDAVTAEPPAMGLREPSSPASAVS